MDKPASSRPTARERLLQTASRLFYERGFRAVGVDEIVAESGVGKMTLYRHFPSKDDLVVAYLERSQAAFDDWFEAALARGDGPRVKLVMAFETLAELAQSPHCLGCTFQVSAAEFPDPKHVAHRIAVRHKRRIRARFARIAKAAGLSEPHILADQLLMLMDGAWVAARMFDRGSPARNVARAANVLIEGHAGGDGSVKRTERREP